MTVTHTESARPSLIPVVTGRMFVAVGVAALAGWFLHRCARTTADRPDRAKCDALRERLGAGVTSGIYDHTAQNRKEEHAPAGDLINDPVDDAVDDSFPCSDPPSYSPRNEVGELV